MLDQNITALLAALLGGLLSMMGVLIANSSSNRIAKKKEIRDLVQEIFKSYQIIDGIYKDLMTSISASVIEKKISEITNYMDGIDRRISLYLPPLEKDFIEYKEQIVSNLRNLEKHKSELPSIEETNKKFRASITKVLNKEGYGYFKQHPSQ